LFVEILKKFSNFIIVTEKNINTGLQATQVWDQLNFQLVRIYDGVIPDNANLGHIVTPFFSIWLIKYGFAKVTVPGKSMTLEPGDWGVFFPDVPRNQQFSKNTQIISVSVKAFWQNEAPLFIKKLPLVFKNTESGDFEGKTLKLHNFVKAQMGFSYNFFNKREQSLGDYLKIKELFYIWLQEWHRVMLQNSCVPEVISDWDPRILSIMNFLNSLNFTPKIPYEHLHRISGLSNIHINRLFKKQVGETPCAYVEKRCLNKASDLIALTCSPFKEICFQLGFSNLSHFSVWFKRRTGKSPKEYRKERIEQF